MRFSMLLRFHNVMNDGQYNFTSSVTFSSLSNANHTIQVLPMSVRSADPSTPPQSDRRHTFELLPPEDICAF